MAKRKRRKLTKAERRAMALRHLAKAHRARRAGRKHGRRRKNPYTYGDYARSKARKGRKRKTGGSRRKRRGGYHPRTLWRKRFHKRRTGLKRYGRNRGEKVKVLTTAERRRRGRRRRRRNPIVNPLPNPRKRRRSGRRKSAKRVAAGKKAARTRKKRLAERRSASRKGHRRKKSNGRRSHGRRRSSGHHKSSKRSRAAKLGWSRRRAGRASRSGTKRAEAEGYAYERRRRRHRRSRRRRNPLNPLPNPRRHHRRHSRRRNPLVNPLPNPMTDAGGFLAKAFGLGIGYLMQDALDRFGATHALTTDSTGTVQDTPAAGQIYDSESVQLPIWSSTTRLAYNAAGLAIPGILGRFFWPEFWNFAFAAAVVRVIGNVATSAVAQFAPANATTLQLYGGEYAANARLQQAAGTALTQAQGGTFAGLPRGRGGRPLAGAPRPRQLAAAPQRKLGDCGCGPTNQNSMLSNVLTDPLQGAQGMLNTPFGFQSDDGCCFNPLTAGTGPDGDTFPQPVTTPTTSPSTNITPITPTPVNTTTSNPNCTPDKIATLQQFLTAAQQNGNAIAYATAANGLANCGISSPPFAQPSPSSTPSTTTPSTTTTPSKPTNTTRNPQNFPR